MPSPGFPLGILAAGAYLAYFTALRLGPVSIVSPVIMAYGGATVVLAVLLRGEVLSRRRPWARPSRPLASCWPE